MTDFKGRKGLVALALVVGLGWLGWPMEARGILGLCTVTTLDDSGPGSLREALGEPCDVIRFQEDLLPGRITLTSGPLVIDRQKFIDGPGADLLAVSGNNLSRVFWITTTGTATIGGLTIRDGVADNGGGLLNEGTATVTNSVVTANSAEVSGGGLLNAPGAQLTIDWTTISGNHASAAAGMTLSGPASVVNSTVSENQATGRAGGIGTTANVVLTHVTVTGNAAISGGGLFNGTGGSSVVAASIIAGNTADQGPDCENRPPQGPGEPAGVLSSAGYNAFGSGGDCVPLASTDLSVSGLELSSWLGPLGDNGGPTQTHALLAGSPAIDHIPAADCTAAIDQRGVVRPQGTGCDIGAFELQPDSTPPVITASVDGTLGSNGWYISNVTVSWTVTDGESTVSSTTGCDASVVDADTPGTSFTCSATSAGGTASETVVVMRDASPPVIGFTGALAYTVDQEVAITCSASDPTSGVASQSCEEASGPAYAFGVGAHTLHATATNGAGLGTDASTSFTVSVTYTSLGVLTRRFVSHAGNAHALGQKLEAAAASDARGNGKAKAGQLGAYQNHVRALTGKSISADHAAVLIRLAGAL